MTPLPSSFSILDNLKVINDTMGYLQGDKLIQLVGERLKSKVNRYNKLYRWGGDEFAFICFDYDNKSEVEAFAKDILSLFDETVEVNKVHFYVTASIGISFYEQKSDTYEDIIKQATTALHHVKKAGKNDYMLHSPTLSEHMIKKLKLSNDLRDAIKRKDFIVYYQPRVDVKIIASQEWKPSEMVGSR